MSANVPVRLDFSQWSFLRAVLEQGMAIHQDYQAGKYPTYEHLSCRLDEAARERDQQLDDAVVAERDTLRDQLQASQCAEAMLTDEVRGLKEQRDSLAKELVETQKELRSVARTGNDQFIQLEALVKERDSLRADAERLRPYLQHRGCTEFVAGVRQCYCGLDSSMKERG